MKKSLIALAVSAAVALPGFAAADAATVTGDARYRMASKTTDVDGGAKTIDADSNHRVRVKVEAKGEGYYVKSRFSTSDDSKGTAGGTAIKADYGFLGVNLGPVTIEGGRVVDNWGNRFFSYDEDYSQVAALFKAGEMDISIWRETAVDGGNYDDNTADSADQINTGVDITGKAGMGNFGVRFESDVSEKGAADMSGSTLAAFYNGQVGPGMLIGSYVSQSGELNEDVDGDSPNGMYVHWIQKFGGITGEVGYVQANNGYTADDHFALFSTVGTSQDTAVMNFGGMKTISVIAVKGSMSVAADTTATLGFGSFTGEACDACDAGKGTAIDLVIKHKIGKNAVAVLSYGTITMDEDLGDTKFTSQGAYIETKF
jgi:hypothetical protein